METRPSVSDVHILLITRLKDSIVCAYLCISHYKAAERHAHKSKVTALQLHDTQRSEVDGSWCMLSIAAFLTLVWKVMDRRSTFTHHRSMHFPWYTAGPQHLLSPRHEGKIHICPSSFALSFSVPSRCGCSISLLLWGSQMRDYHEDQSTPSNHFHPQSSLMLTLCHPAMVLPTPWSRSTSNPSIADGACLYRPKTVTHWWLTVIPKPGPSPSSCVIRQLK